jgi:hypothetical protein
VITMQSVCETIREPCVKQSVDLHGTYSEIYATEGHPNFVLLRNFLQLIITTWRKSETLRIISDKFNVESVCNKQVLLNIIIIITSSNGRNGITLFLILDPMTSKCHSF